MIETGAFMEVAKEVITDVTTKELMAAEIIESQTTSDVVEGMIDEIGSNVVRNMPSEVFLDYSNEINITKEINEKTLENSEMMFIKAVKERIGTAEGIKDLLERYPEKADLWNKQLDSIKRLQTDEISDFEARSIQSQMSNLKGQLMETSVKDVLSEIGFSVEEKQRVISGEIGGTKPDVVGINNTDDVIKFLGIDVQPGEIVSGECKCGSSSYIFNELLKHIPNQLSGQEGNRFLFATSDIEKVSSDLLNKVCSEYGTKLVNVKINVTDVENAIMEVAKK